ncbi:MAG: hypothetical protein KBS91_04635 [Firmicutes bacterium]|nr:hypothetical protein [Candidatus Caballimonas caccae]
MYYFKIEIAEYVIEVNALYEGTKKYCKDFFSSKAPDFEITITEQDIEKVKEQSITLNKKRNLPTLDMPNYNYEISALLEKIVILLLDYNIIFFHGSVIAYNGKAYMFTAPSGTGKTTHTKLWLKNIKGCYVLNGDKPLIKFDGDKIYACGTPWRGKEGYGVNEILPLSAICYLNRDIKNHIEESNLKELLNPFFNQIYFPKNGLQITKILTNLSKLKNIKLYKLGCNMEDEASIVAFNEIIKN